MFKLGLFWEFCSLRDFWCFWECEVLHCNCWFWIYFIFVHVKEGMGANVWVCSERENGLKNFLSKETINQAPCEFSVF